MLRLSECVTSMIFGLTLSFGRLLCYQRRPPKIHLRMMTYVPISEFVNHVSFPSLLFSRFSRSKARLYVRTLTALYLRIETERVYLLVFRFSPHFYNESRSHLIFICIIYILTVTKSIRGGFCFLQPRESSTKERSRAMVGEKGHSSQTTRYDARLGESWLYMPF